MTPTLSPPRAARPLSPRQLEVLTWIKAYIADHENVAPTLDEIAAAIGKSKVTAMEHCRELKAKGWITMERYRSRSIRIVEDVCPTCGHRNGSR